MRLRAPHLFGPLLAASLAVALVPTTAAAQESEAEAPVTREEFRAAIAERDAIIINLSQRLRNLEQRLAQAEGTPPPAQEAVAPPPSTGTDEEAPAAPAAEPGQIAVDELTAQRALERGLVESGALLLPSGQAELSPRFLFQHNSTADSTLAVIDDTSFVGDRTVTSDVFDAGLALRYGLPWEAQVEVYLPYRVVGRSETTDVLGSVVSNQNRTASGFGDLRVGLAKTLVQGERGRAGLIGRVSWDSSLGKREDDGIALGGGFNELQGSLTGVLRSDPLVFVGTAGYRYTFERGALKPGAEYLFSLGTSLAVSPDASLSMFLNQIYAEDFATAGRKLDGTGGLSSTLNLGGSIILARDMLLQIDASAGLTDNAADYRFGISLPIRF